MLLNANRGLKQALSAVALLVCAASQAADYPSLDVCVKYAEADHAFEAAARAAGSVFEAAAREANAARKVATGKAYAAYQAATDKADAARDAAVNEPLAALESAVDKADAARAATYAAIYAADGGTRSEVPTVMRQLYDRHRAICRELHRL